ncbi:hypothetical protein QCA50_009119 [Cerrena zonata]|uniref:Uncharacterized protein n=1 Tax=Cerrena zonata TaxID=2478898 RepID=A0AAW0G329_9APHY
MRDMIPEQQIHPLELYGSTDYDYDYDVHYFGPSIARYIVSPEDFEVLYHLQGPSLNRWAFQVDDDLPRRPISPALSFSYTITSDFMFPDVASEASLEGYSRLFRAGLTSASHRLSRRLGTVSYHLREAFRLTKRKVQIWVGGAFTHA